jgi:hypothetical protein
MSILTNFFDENKKIKIFDVNCRQSYNKKSLTVNRISINISIQLCDDET